jgi:uncharacterized protein
MDGGQRLVLLDALRGFALCGVFISNVYLWFSGRVLLSPAQAQALNASGSLLDAVARFTINFLVFGKFITLFSFLFGLGFAVQLGRAEQRGASIVPLYLRRLAVLLLIGLAHMFLIWFGDILSSYALMGFALLLFRNRSDKTLWIWAALSALVAPLVIQVLQQHPELLGSAPSADAAKEAMLQSAARKEELLAAYARGHYLEVVPIAARVYVREFMRLHLLFLLPIFGRFLLGLLAGRLRLLHDVSLHRSQLRKLLVAGLLVGAMGNGVGLVLQALSARKVLDLSAASWLPYVLNPVRSLGELGLAAFYLASFALLFQRVFWQRLLSVFAPAGRMALTHYLSQSVISVFIFYGYGLGLIGQVRPAACMAICLGIFAAQVLLSHLWLARFRFGPIEWVWRSLTYGKAQPMRRAPSAVPVSSA